MNTDVICGILFRTSKASWLCPLWNRSQNAGSGSAPSVCICVHLWLIHPCVSAACSSS